MPQTKPAELSEFHRLEKRLGIAFASLVAVTGTSAVGFWVIGGGNLLLICVTKPVRHHGSC